MIEKESKKRLLKLQGFVTVMAIPGAGKTSLLSALGVDFRPEPTADIETLGIRLSKTEYSQIVFDRLYQLDSNPSPFWRDSDSYTSLGIFQSPGTMIDAIPKYPGVIPSDHLIWLNLPMEQTVRQIIQRNRRSAMMEIENTPIRFERAEAVFQHHPAKNKIILTQNSAGHWRILATFGTSNYKVGA